MYTDDTEMMIGVAESLVRRRGLDALDVLRTMAAGYDPARGYGKGMKRAFEALADGMHPATATWPEGSRGNGAAVRVVPLACLHHHEPEALAALAHGAAAITHAHPVALAGCVLHALALARALALDPDVPLDAAAFLQDLATRVAGCDAGISRRLAAMAGMVANPPPPREVVAALGNGVAADESVPVALFAFLASPRSFEEIVLRAIEYGGDTDTIGAMSGALAGASCGMHGIPASWLDRIENSHRGKDHVIELADELYRLWSARTQVPFR